MVGEQHGLCTLEVRVPGHDDLDLLLGAPEQHPLEFEGQGIDPPDRFLQVHARVERDLIVPAPAGVELFPCRTDPLDQPLFNQAVDILEGAVEREGSRLHLLLDLGESLQDEGCFLGADDSLFPEHPAVGHGPFDVLRVEPLVKGERCIEAVQDLLRPLLETSSPHLVTHIRKPTFIQPSKCLSRDVEKSPDARHPTLLEV